MQSYARRYQALHRVGMRQRCAQAASDRLAPSQRATWLGARHYPLLDAEIDAGEFSQLPSYPWPLSKKAAVTADILCCLCMTHCGLAARKHDAVQQEAISLPKSAGVAAGA